VCAQLQELSTLRAESDRLTKRVFTQRGTLDQLQANISKNKNELAVPMYKDIDEAYKSKRVELITTELANHDLDKYYKALDQTLMKFHNDKMQEINKIVKELWQQTYQVRGGPRSGGG
jgi:DNA repair protein RAD50